MLRRIAVLPLAIVLLSGPLLAGRAVQASPIPPAPVLWQVNSDGTGEQRFSDIYGDVYGFDWSPDGSQVVYSRRGVLFVADSDGTDERALTGEGEYAYNPDWSPDGPWIAWTMNGDSAFGIHLISPDATQRRFLPAGDSLYDLTWSPDSTRISYVAGGSVPADIYVVYVDTGVSEVLLPESALYAGTDWSFDGEWIDFLTPGYNVGTVRADGHESHVITTSGEASRGEWAPDRSVLAFQDGGDIKLWDPRRQEITTLTEGVDPAWSPDGSTIAFSRGEAIWKIDTASGEEQRLTETGLWTDTDPLWNFDGSKILFLRTRTQVLCSTGAEYPWEASIVGTAGDDTLYGTRDVDVIAGLGGDDEIFGFEGDDVICGDSGNDLIHGGAGDDVLGGYDGGDHLRGDGGNDMLLAGPGRDTFDGGGGSDTVSYSYAAGRVVVDLLHGVGRGWGRDSIVSVSNVVGGGYNDLLRGDATANKLRGDYFWTSGDDILIGRGGPDHLQGLRGADHLDGGRGRDFLSGGPGYDRCIRGETFDTCE